jgi:hypothetical protein
MGLRDTRWIRLSPYGLPTLLSFDVGCWPSSAALLLSTAVLTLSITT